MIITSMIITGGLTYLGIELFENLEKHQGKKAKATAKYLSSGRKHKNSNLSIKELISQKSREQQTKELTTIQKSEEEKAVDYYLNISLGMLGTAIAGLYFAPFNLLTIGGAIIAGRSIFKTAWKSVTKEKKVNIEVIDTLIITTTFGMGYFVAGSIGALFYFSAKKLLLRTEDQSKKKLINIYGEQPRHIWIVKEELEIKIPFEQLEIGNTISVRAGETIPIDGKIVYGQGLVEQHALTGESQPVEKKIGDDCFAATLLIEGRIHIKVEKSGSETTVSQIGEILNQSIDFKEEMITKGQQLADQSALPLLALSGLSLPIVGPVGSATILYANFGYSLRMVSPVMMLNFLTIASQEGILIKDGRSLEFLNQVDTIVFDKTGTLTLTKPHVASIHTLNGISENDLLTYAAAAEHRQQHPIALAIVEEAKNRQLKLPEIEEVKYEIGYGLKVKLIGEIIRIGSAKFMRKEEVEVPVSILNQANQAQQNGHSFVYVAIGKKLHGALELHPTIRPEAKRVVDELKANGKQCYIISGDHLAPTQYLAKQLGIDNYFAQVLPEEKADYVSQLQNQGKTVCFIGDGINDSIALKTADLSISLQGASTIATDTAQIILMNETLHSLPFLFKIGKEFEQNMKNNIAVSVIPSIITIGGVFFFNLGIMGAIILSQIGLIAGIGNSISPLVNYQAANKKTMEKGYKK